METVLEVLQWSKPHKDAVITHSEAITAIKAALAQPAPVEGMVASMMVEDGRISFAARILADGTYDLYTTPPAAQPAQEPVNQTLFGYEIFGCFFRNFDEALNAFKNQGLTWATPDGPFNGMNEDWIKKNIREVYVHGTSELERLNNIGNGGPINTQTD
jgi:hypothetical protein